MRALGIADARAPSPGDALDVLGAAAAVIGIDTGLTHIAVQQGTPTVTICRAPAVYFRPWPHTRAPSWAIRATTRASPPRRSTRTTTVVDLRGFRWQPPTCPVGGRCLDSVQPEDVLGALEQRAVSSRVEVDAYPESRVHNSQPHGIGRVVALDGLCAWNNLGRNVVFAGEDFRPRAVFDESVFSEDEPSQYDLDVHAILDVPSAGIVVTLNHFGMVRAFSSDDIRHRGRCAASHRCGRARSRRTWSARSSSAIVSSDPGRAKKVLRGSSSVSGSRRRTSSGPLEMHVQLETLGMVTALAAFRDGTTDCIAVGGNGQVSLAAGPPTASVRRAGPSTWTSSRGSSSGTARVVWAAGSERVERRDRRLRLGGARRWRLRRARPGRRACRRAGSFPEDLAWGNGGVAVVLVPGALCGIGRRGQLHMFDTRDGSRSPPARRSPTLRSASRTPPPWATRCSTASIGAAIGSMRIRVPPYSLRLRYGTKRLRPVRTSSKSASNAACSNASCSCSTGRRAAYRSRSARLSRAALSVNAMRMTSTDNRSNTIAGLSVVGGADGACSMSAASAASIGLDEARVASALSASMSRLAVGDRAVVGVVAARRVLAVPLHDVVVVEPEQQPEDAVACRRRGLVERAPELGDDIRDGGQGRSAPRSSRSALEVSEHRSCRRANLGRPRLATRAYAPDDDVARGEHAVARCLQLASTTMAPARSSSSWPRTSSVRRDARDLHDEASRLHPAPLARRRAGRGSRPRAARHRPATPAPIRRGPRCAARRRTCSTMSWRAVSASERWTSLTFEPARASSSASRVPLSPPPITTTSRPTNRSGRASSRYVTSPPKAPSSAAGSCWCIVPVAITSARPRMRAPVDFDPSLTEVDAGDGM